PRTLRQPSARTRFRRCESPLASEKLTNLVRVTERRPPVWIPNQVHRASRIDAPASGREREDREVRRRGGEEERVEAVEHAAVRAEEAAAVFHARVALEERLEQVAHGAGDGEYDAQDDRLRNRQEVLLVQRDEGDEDRRRRAEDEALPRLPRRHRRRHLVAADQSPCE